MNRPAPNVAPFTHFPERWKDDLKDKFCAVGKSYCDEKSSLDEALVLVASAKSQKGLPLEIYRWGYGPIKVSLLAGCHSDEPLGPHVLSLLLDWSRDRDEKVCALLKKFSFFICPHINPDGEAENRPWIEKYPDFEAYVRGAFREAPGRDLEFGFPSMRQENQFWSSVIQKEGPFDLHMSLHGMGYSEGFLLLMERHVHGSYENLKDRFRQLATGLGFGLHDHDRKGDKGFRYFGAGFASTPEGAAMQKYFRDRGEDDTAEKFHFSSMEYVRQLGRDPLCLVSELPLFAIASAPEESKPGLPLRHISLREKLKGGEALAQILADYLLEPLGVRRGTLAMLSLIDMALDEVHQLKGSAAETEPGESEENA